MSLAILQPVVNGTTYLLNADLTALTGDAVYSRKLDISLGEMLTDLMLCCDSTLLMQLNIDKAGKRNQSGE
jgi:hypothetical protein